MAGEADESKGGPRAAAPGAPVLYQVNIRIWLNALARRLGRAATLDDLPDADLDRFAQSGFDYLYLLGVWGSGPTSRRIAGDVPELVAEYQDVLPDFSADDVCGSCFAIAGYTVPEEMGGAAALARLRRRLHDRGMRLMVDFIPNHVGRDHPWVTERPDLLLQGREEDAEEFPDDYFRARTAEGEVVLAHGKDPYFPGWTDTVQLDYGTPELQAAMRAELEHIAEQADAVRCDMAMLVVPEVFERTWGRVMEPFWPRAIAEVKAEHPEFRFLAEVYWNMQERLLEDGFDYCYDKLLYDRVIAGDAGGARERLALDPAVQGRFARFLENHDEPRAAELMPLGRHRAAAIVTFLVPGLRFLHEGQLEGARRRIPVQLCRAPEEPVDEGVEAFYATLLPLLHHPALAGAWRQRDLHPPWDGLGPWEQFIASTWTGPEGEWLLVVVNFGAEHASCRIPLDDLPPQPGDAVVLRDVTGNVEYQRDVSEVTGPGLHVDLPGWGYHVFEVKQG